MNPLLQPIKELIDKEKIRDADQLIREINEHNDPKVIGELIMLLDDKCKYHEIMYSVIHSVEALEDTVYVNNFLEKSESLLKSAPNWAGELLIRIINNAKTFSILMKLLNVDPEKKSVINKVREYSMKIKKDMPLF